MYHLIAIQFFCACFCAFLAGRAGSSRLFWWTVGGLLPVLGVVLCLTETRKPRPANRDSLGERAPKGRPRRCCGHYIPECGGCPYFRRPLFGNSPEAGRGRCTYFDKDLTEEETSRQGTVTIEDT